MRTHFIMAGFLAATSSLSAAQDGRELLETLGSFGLTDVALPDGLPSQFSTLIEFPGGELVLNLEKRSIWAPEAYILVIGENGPEQLPVPEVNTYRGSVAGIPGSSVSASLQSDGLHAQIHIPDVPTHAVEPLARSGGLHVAYTRQNIYAEPGFCEQPPDRQRPELEDRVPTVTLPGGAAAFHSGGGGSSHVAELGIDADFEYILATGGFENAVEEISAIVNSVNEVFERDTAITHVVTVLQFYLDAASDPYTSTIGVEINDEQAAHWTSDPELSNVGYDLAMLMTGKDTCGSSGCNLLGRAKGIGVVCDRAEAFCFNEYLTNDTSQTLLVAHELGHLWNGRHCDTDPASGCINGDCRTMCSFIGDCQNGSGVEFAPCNAARIVAHRDSRTCLDPGTTEVEYVEWRSCGIFCPENGDIEDPHNTVEEAVDEVLSGGTVIIKGGSSADALGDETFPLRIDKAVTLRTLGTLGASLGD